MYFIEFGYVNNHRCVKEQLWLGSYGAILALIEPVFESHCLPCKSLVVSRRHPTKFARIHRNITFYVQVVGMSQPL